MNIRGLELCARYAYPPNSLSLCGPDRKKELHWYSKTRTVDKGTAEIIAQFQTLFPYLTLIAHENKRLDPFEEKVVEAYWLGNELLRNIKIKSFSGHLTEKLSLKKKIKRAEIEKVLEKIGHGALPNHAFHVLNIYLRTGNMEELHTLQTMDACIINAGKITKITPNAVFVATKPLVYKGKKLTFGPQISRWIKFQSEDDLKISKLKAGDWISYHWGQFCEKLTPRQLKNLTIYTNHALLYVNKKI